MEASLVDVNLFECVHIVLLVVVFIVRLFHTYTELLT